MITGGKRPAQLQRLVASIRRQAVPAHEIIVAGGEHDDGLGVISVPAAGAADAGLLGQLRNLAVARARYEMIAILDDDMVLADGWYAAIAQFKGSDIQTSRVLLPDGTRYWDHATIGGPRGHRLLRHDEPVDGFTYMSGGTAWVMRDDVAAAVRWDDTLVINKQEDVRFSRACLAAGFRIEHNPAAVAYHADGGYTRVGRVIMRRRAGADNRWLMASGALSNRDGLHALATKESASGQLAEYADCLRAGMDAYPEDHRFANEFRRLEGRFGGDPLGDQFALEGDAGLRRLMADLGGVPGG